MRVENAKRILKKQLHFRALTAHVSGAISLSGYHGKRSTIMGREYIALIILAGLILLGLFMLVKLVNWAGRRGDRNLLRGHLREDYIKNNPDLVQGSRVFCRCGCKKLILRNVPPTRAGADVVREHVCISCGNRLFFSVGGEYLEKIAQELRTEAGYA